MLLGQAAATAAVQAVNEHEDIQKISYRRLRIQLEKDGQVLVWQPED